jgi:outer membrane protein assembly factor BamB
VKRALAAAAVVVVLLFGAAGGYVLYRKHQQRNVHGSPTVEFVTTAPQPVRPPSELTTLPWPTYGFDNLRTRFAQGIDVTPPFDVLWGFRAQALVEFPPAVAYGRLYFANNDGVFFAVSARTGQRAWKFVSGRCVAASPAVGGGLVYMTFLNRPPCNAPNGADGLVAAFRAGTGKIAWERTIGPSETSPLLAGGRVYVGDWRGDLWALRAADGKPVWRFHAGGRIKGGVALDGPRLYFGSYDGHVYALDARDGKLLWKASAQGTLLGGGTFYATPALAYGRVYIGATDGKVYSFGAQTGKLRWSYGTGGYVYSSAAVWRGLVLVGSYSGTFFALDAATGGPKWRFHADGPISGSPTVVHGIVYFATLKQRTYGLDARTGRVVWSFPDGKYAPVVVDSRRLYLVGYARVYGLLPRNAQPLLLTEAQARAALGGGRFQVFASAAEAKRNVRRLHGGRICNVVILGRRPRRAVARLRAACAG